MTPRELQEQIARRGVQPVYLFIGPDSYHRTAARQAVTAAALGDGDPEDGITRLDLDSLTLPQVIDDASSLSLFARRRLIWVSNAEGALPKRLTAKEDDDGPGALLAAYVKDPTPETVLVFDAARYGYEGEEKQKLDRVRKFYSAIPNAVEFAPVSPSDAARLAREKAKELGLPLSNEQATELADALAADATRIVVELQKLVLYAQGRPLSAAEFTALIPNARASTIFSLVNALARGDRRASLDVLDNLVREGEYLPLVLSFLGTQFRLALGAAEAGCTTPGQIQGFLSKQGAWRVRSEQLAETIRAFPPARLRRAVTLTAEADRALRDTRPDDRTVVESFLWKLTAGPERRA
jgi:DNA polymerase-3 subunit delta